MQFFNKNVMRVVTGERSDWFELDRKAKVTQIITLPHCAE